MICKISQKDPFLNNKKIVQDFNKDDEGCWSYKFPICVISYYNSIGPISPIFVSLTG